MTTVMVWLLVVVGGYNSNNVNVVERFATSAECQRVISVLPNAQYVSARCIQATVLAAK